jgi:formylglycine-generating enzyme required for sulfatase activity
MQADQIVERKYLRIVLSETGSPGLVPAIPSVGLAALSYTVNDGPSRVLDLRNYSNSGIAISTGDKLTLSEFWYWSDQSGSLEDTVNIEMYLVQEDIDWDGGFSTEPTLIDKGRHSIAGFPGYGWVITKDTRKLRIVIVQNQEIVVEELYIPLSTDGGSDLVSLQPEHRLEAGAYRVQRADDSVMVFVPAGTFWMGSTNEDIDAVLEQCGDCKRDSYIDEQPRREVYLDAFWIDRTEVTNARYQQCVKDGECSPPKYLTSETRDEYYGNPEFGDYPVVNVSWYQAAAYCRWADKRLPTEAEWEKAARGIDGRIYPWGNTWDARKANSAERWLGDTVAVGSYVAGKSPFNALNMAGNVWEWVEDSYDERYYDRLPASNPKGPDSGNNRVYRGGSWTSDWASVRTANREGHSPDMIHHKVGFRCALSASMP